MDFLATLDPGRWAALTAAGLLIGIAKAGLDGGSLIAVPLLALTFGARLSSGLLLGIMLAADLVAVYSYRREVQPQHLIRLLPWAVGGTLLGAIVGGAISEQVFRMILSSGIILCCGLMAVRELRGGDWVLPNRWWSSAPLGLLAGFTSMVGNAAGPVMGLYLVSSGLKKTGIIGTSVYFFFLINLCKLPFHVFFWKTVTPGTLLADAIVAPLAVGATFLGVRLVRLIPERPYRIILISVSSVAGFYLLLR